MKKIINYILVFCSIFIFSPATMVYAEDVGLTVEGTVLDVTATISANYSFSADAAAFITISNNTEGVIEVKAVDVEAIGGAPSTFVDHYENDSTETNYINWDFLGSTDASTYVRVGIGDSLRNTACSAVLPIGHNDYAELSLGLVNEKTGASPSIDDGSIENYSYAIILGKINVGVETTYQYNITLVTSISEEVYLDYKVPANSNDLSALIEKVVFTHTYNSGADELVFEAEIYENSEITYNTDSSSFSVEFIIPGESDVYGYPHAETFVPTANGNKLTITIADVSTSFSSLPDTIYFGPNLYLTDSSWNSENFVDIIPIEILAP